MNAETETRTEIGTDETVEAEAEGEIATWLAKAETETDAKAKAQTHAPPQMHKGDQNRETEAGLWIWIKTLERKLDQWLKEWPTTHVGLMYWISIPQTSPRPLCVEKTGQVKRATEKFGNQRNW